ncbi:MAG: hypothetical protein P8K78_09860 [Pirellulales bacterium]|nr:hypothetical protein [Pirellulales bacterium]
MMVPSSPENQLIESSFLFRFAVPCYHCGQRWKKGGVSLPQKYMLPSFDQLDKPSSAENTWADVRIGWSTEGIFLNFKVTGKKQPPWCRESRIEDSDGIAIWVNTRNGSQIHRASRFCHEFHFLPLGAGANQKQPIAAQLEIRRAKEVAKNSPAHGPKLHSVLRSDGYTLSALVPADGLTGFDPEEVPQIGFHFRVSDRELGDCSMTVGDPFPTDADPSLWSALDLIAG